MSYKYISVFEARKKISRRNAPHSRARRIQGNMVDNQLIGELQSIKLRLAKLAFPPGNPPVFGNASQQELILDIQGLLGVLESKEKK